MVRRLAAKVLSVVAPRLLWRLRIRLWKVERSEAEIALVPLLCSRSKIGIDIGAFDGLYTIHMLGYSRAVYAFEPRPDAANALMKEFCGSRPPVHVEAVALSRRSGTATMRLCLDDLGWSTIEPNAALRGSSGVRLVEVPTRRLDDYCLSGVSLVKIDVEGHEEAVLEGAIETLRREKPSLIIEIEERHNPGGIWRIQEMLAPLGYSAFFFHDRRLRSFAEFRIEVHQNQTGAGAYVCNFVFAAPHVFPLLKRCF